MSNLHSVLILGPDAVQAAAPATVIQLVHACHRWGFSTVVPASWGDELIATEVIKRCALRENRPAIQCSCPRVAERLGANAGKIADSVFWLATPPVATAQYIRAHSTDADVHITYAGSCPGAIDASIDQRMSPNELLMAIGSRGIDIGAQPTVFENIIPPDRRRHFSNAGGLPEAQRLWEAAAFRVAQPSDIDLSIGVAQLLLAEDRVLIDMSGQAGCVCRSDSIATDPTALLRAPSPVVHDGLVDVGRSAPVSQERVSESRRPLVDAVPFVEPATYAAPASLPKRNSPGRAAFRRQSAWRRQTPRPSGAVMRASAVMIAVPETPTFLKRRDVRAAIATVVTVGALVLGIWIGRHSSTPGVNSSAITPAGSSVRTP